VIIANLVGGLGNQMFQYACARSLALDLDMPLRFSVDMFGSYNAHNGFELERVFGLKLKFSSDKDLGELIGWARKKPAIRHLLSKRSFRWLAGHHFLGESDLSCWPKQKVLALHGGYLHGYWQSERYFQGHTTRIRSDFRFREELQGVNRRIALAISQSPSISVHIRRGDYVSNPKALAVHGICSPDYYHKAIKTMLHRYPNAQLFAFSDDPSWVAQVLKPYYPQLVLVDCNKGTNSHNDMRLMSMCDHHIIANSSFSWWGGWLNAKPGKVVIAPSRWFADGRNTQDLIPEAWEKI
jgi:hypothetical protein